MTKQQKIENAEAFVARVVTQTFKQKIDPETLRAVAEKLARAVEVEPERQSA